MGDDPRDLIQEGDNVDGEAAAFFWPAGLPFQEIEAPFPAAVHNDKVARTSAVGGPLLPLAAFLFLGAKHQTAEPGGKVAVGKVLGGAAGFATAGCAENAHAGLCVGEAKGVAVPPIPQHRLRVEFRQGIVRGSHAGKGAKAPAKRQGKSVVPPQGGGAWRGF